MRSTPILPALLVLFATAAQANDRVVQASIFDEAQPHCAASSDSCSAMVGTGCAASGCAEACGSGSGSGSGSGKCCGKGKGCDNGKCHKCKGGKCAAILSGNGKCNMCNMPQHLRYNAVDHGYYYFRPYNYRHIREQQEAVQAWGGDPRNPYSNEIFKTIYAQSDLNGIQDAPIQMPGSVEPIETVQPTEPPVPMPMIDPTASTPKFNQLRMISTRQ